jgi:hypothetical protein
LYVMDEIDAALDFKNVSFDTVDAEIASRVDVFANIWGSGFYRGCLHQGAHQERAVHRHLAAQQHVRARFAAGRRV